MVKIRHLVFHRALDVVVMVPAAVGHGYEADAGLHKAAGEQHTLAGGVAAVFIAQLGVFLFDVESLTSLLGGDEAVSALIEGVHALKRVGLLDGREVGINRLTHGAAGGETLVIHTAREHKVTNLEAGTGRIRTQTERAVSGTQITGSTVGRDTRNGYIGREVVARSKLMGDHGAEARVFQSRAGTDARHHVVGAALVGRLAVRHRTHHGDLVGNLRRFLHQLGEVGALNLGLHGPQRAAILDGGIHLRVERLLMGHAARQVNIDDVLGLAFLGGSGLVGVGLQDVPKRQPQSSQRAHLEKVAAGGVEAMLGRIAPARLIVAHRNRFQVTRPCSGRSRNKVIRCAPNKFSTILFLVRTGFGTDR